jgi:16S rRNA (cytosine1402-N4)-methyltransferase
MCVADGGHVPVLLDAVLGALAPQPGQVIADGTFGAGGYARALLAAGARVVAIDRDPEAVALGRALAAHEPRLVMCHGRFGDIARLVAGVGHERVDAVVLDLGVSSRQLDRPERGFSFQRAGPLDMRMEADGPTAADLLAAAPLDELARVLRDYGDEPDARRIARAIVAERAVRPLVTTDQLAALVARVKGGRRGARDPATRTFQALRMWVNDEPGELERGLLGAEALLRHGGRLAVVSFHSGEDRRVKRFVDERGGRLPGTSRHAPPTEATPRAWSWVTRKAARPGPAEIQANPRARSARLRVAVRHRATEEARADEPTAGWRAAA